MDGKSVQLALWDTAGQEDYERLRPLAYSKAHVILIGFSVDTPDSLDNVKHKVRRLPLVQHLYTLRLQLHPAEVLALCEVVAPRNLTNLASHPFIAAPTVVSQETLVLTLARLFPDDQWVEEATEKCPGVPIILVGLKKDLRSDPVAIDEMRKKSLRFVAEHDGEAAAREIGARKYLECSSLTGEGVDDVFEAATRAALLTFEKGEHGGCCVIL